MTPSPSSPLDPRTPVERLRDLLNYLADEVDYEENAHLNAAILARQTFASIAPTNQQGAPICPGCEKEHSGYCYACESKDQAERTQGADPGQPAAGLEGIRAIVAEIDSDKGARRRAEATMVPVEWLRAIAAYPVPAVPAAPVENPLAEKLQEVSTKMVIYEGIIREALEHLRIGNPGWDSKARRALEKSGVVVWPDVPAGASLPGSASTGEASHA